MTTPGDGTAAPAAHSELAVVPVTSTTDANDTDAVLTSQQRVLTEPDRRLPFEFRSAQGPMPGGTGWCGMHSENGFWRTMFGVLCWDEIRAQPSAAGCSSWADFPGTMQARLAGMWLHPFQSLPRDFGGPMFYLLRQAAFNARFAKLGDMTRCQLAAEAARAFQDHLYTPAWGVRWDCYSADVVANVVHAMGSRLVVSVLRKMAANFRSYCSGAPDLLLWKPMDCHGRCEPPSAASPSFALLEVKGEGDSLRAGQMVWLDTLVSIGAPAFLCHVTRK